MGSEERRERERTQTRQKILNAARDLFVEHGYEATTMRAIANRIEYTPTAIYHHFRSKEALLLELSAADFRALAQAFQRIGRVADPIERLERIGEAYVDFALSHPMHYQLLFMTKRPPLDALWKEVAHDDPGESAYAFLVEACTEAIEQGRLRTEFDDPYQVAQMLWSGMHGIVSLQIVKGKDEWIQWRDTRVTGARIREVIVHGLTRNETA